MPPGEIFSRYGFRLTGADWEYERVGYENTKERMALYGDPTWLWNTLCRISQAIQGYRNMSEPDLNQASPETEPLVRMLTT